jgi:cytochrome c oxidase assembly protein subunit 11
MPLLFFIDKDVLEDPACRNLDDIVLSYTFFKWVFFLVICITTVTRVLTSMILRARRNAHGQLEPDAPEGKVLASQGWSDVKFAPKTQA